MGTDWTDADWGDLVRDLTLDVTALEYRQFLEVEFHAGLDLNPYAQVTPEFAGGWYCEVVSAHFLPERVWPVDEFALLAAGWSIPAVPGENWSCLVETAEAAATRLAEGLRFGRLCRDPRIFVWSSHGFPPPPDGRRDPDPIRPRSPFSLAA